MFQRFDKGSVHMNRSDWIVGPGLKLDLKVIELRMSGSDVPRPLEDPDDKNFRKWLSYHSAGSR